jgi:hypothetical protein
MFSFTFYNKFDETYKFFLVKSAFYNLDMEPEPATEPELEPEPESEM